MPTKIFFDTEFTSLLHPELLSVGLVTLDGLEHYAELDLESESGKTRLAETDWNVHENIVEDRWGVIPDSACESESAIGQRVGHWLLSVAESAQDGRIALLYDYSTNYELLVGALEEGGAWPAVSVVASQHNIGGATGTIGPELASEATFTALRRRRPQLFRHHALADAIALRAAWRTWHLVQERAGDFGQLLRAVGDAREAWLYEWLTTTDDAFGGASPLDVLDQSTGLQLV